MNITHLNEDGTFAGTTDDDVLFVASFPLFIIHVAWHKGCSFEDTCDGFGLGAGTHGDWSAIRDSSQPQLIVMLNRACEFLELTR